MADLHECTVSWCTNYSHTKRVANLCQAHYQRKYRGLDPEKTDVPQVRKICIVEDCGMVVSMKELCTKHYGHARLGKITVTGFTPKPYPVCAGPKCLRAGSHSGYCSTHYAQSTVGATKTLYELKPKTRPSCSVVECENEVSSLRSVLCKKHGVQRTLWNVPIERYLELKSQTECEACGDNFKVVTDHIHGHHASNTSMCEECIRGRLCHGCNVALGSLRDSPERIRGLLAYATKHLDKAGLALSYGT